MRTSIADKLLDHSMVILIALSALAAFFAYNIPNFKVDASADTLLTKNNRDYIVSQIVDIRYNPDEFILIAVKPKQGPIFSSRNLLKIAKISENIKKIERVEEVNSIVNAPIFALNDNLLDAINPESLTWNEQRYSQKDMERVLKAHPLYESMLYNKQQDALGIQVVFKENRELTEVNGKIVDIQKKILSRELDDKEKAELRQLQKKKEKLTKSLDRKRYNEIDEIRLILKQYESFGEFYLGGSTLLAKQLIDIIKSDLVVFGITIIAIVAILLYLLFRKLRWVVLPIITCAYSVVATLGLLAALNLKVTVISANVIALQIILTLAVVIHMIIQYKELAVKSSANTSESDNPSENSHHQLVADMVKRKFKPCFYASITTGVGFASLIFSGIQPVISFGWMMVLALTITLAASLLFFPAMLRVSFKEADRSTVSHRFIETSLAACVRLIEKRKKLIVLGSGLTLVAGLAGCFFLTAENSFLNYFKDSTDVKRELSFIDKEFGGSTPLDIVIKMRNVKESLDLEIPAEDLQRLETLQYRLEQYKAVGSSTSIADFARVGREVRNKPLTEVEVSIIYKLLQDDLRNRLFGPYYSDKHDELRLSMRIKDTTEGLNREKLKNDIEQEIQDVGIEKGNYTLTNLFVLYQDILAKLVNSQLTTLAIVYLVMAVIMLIIFKSLKIATICLAPNILTTAVVMGLLGWLRIPLDIMTITIAAVAMGVSVDDTIHYVHRFLEEKNASHPVEASHMTVGYAMLYTTIIIVIGFGSLYFSNFVPSMIFGVLTGVAMIVALLADLLLLPVLLTRYVSKS